MTSFSAEFDDTPADRATLLRTAGDLLVAGRQFAVTPRFDVGGAGPAVKSGWILAWPSAVHEIPPAGAA